MSNHRVNRLGGAALAVALLSGGGPAGASSPVTPSHTEAGSPTRPSGHPAPPGDARAPHAARVTSRPAFGIYLAGIDALRANNFAVAADNMLRALAADPTNHTLREQAFLAAALAGRPEAARLASGLPDNGAAVLLLGDRLAMAGAWNEAAHAFATAPHDGSVVDVLRPVLVAWAEAGAGHTSLALQTLAPLLAGTRLPGLYAVQAALIADLAGRRAEADADYHLAQTASPELNLTLVRIFADAAAREGRVADAKALIHSLIASAPSLVVAEAGLDASLTTPVVGSARAGLASAYMSVTALMAEQSPADTSALLLLRYGLALDPGSSETRLLISDVEQSLHDTDAALAVLQPIRASDPLFAAVELREAELDEMAGHDGAALGILRSLAEAEPGQPEPYRELGEILSEQQRYGEAVVAFDHAIAAIPHPAGDDWQILFDRAVALDKSHQWNRAEADLLHALLLSPEQPLVLNYLAYSDAEQDRDLAHARRMVERALDQKPHNGAYLDTLGWIMLKQAEIGPAIDTLQQAAELTPEDPTVNYHLGVAYWQAGRRVEAEDQWQRALILKPDPGDLTRIKARLREAAAGNPNRASP